jgi:predicted  nucleic acid-binding Zn-ribbon protein
MNQEARDKADVLAQRHTTERHHRDLGHDRRAMESQIDVLQSKLASVAEELRVVTNQEKDRAEMARLERGQLSKARSAD